MTELSSAPVAATESCRNCGTLLADDQRYCLNCGARRSDARLDPLRELGAQPPATALATAPPRAMPSLVDRAGGPAGIAAMLLAAVGVGLLLGRSHNTEVRTVLQRAPVVNVSGTPAGAVAPATTGAAGESISSGSDSGSGASSKGSDAGGGTKSTGKSKPASKALSKTETKKAAASIKAAQNKIKNAPKTLSTGGSAPKKDNKAAGGGSGGGESIG